MGMDFRLWDSMIFSRSNCGEPWGWIFSWSLSIYGTNGRYCHGLPKQKSTADTGIHWHQSDLKKTTVFHQCPALPLFLSLSLTLLSLFLLLCLQLVVFVRLCYTRVEQYSDTRSMLGWRIVHPKICDFFGSPDRSHISFPHIDIMANPPWLSIFIDDVSPLKTIYSGWWFGTFLFFHILGIVTPTDFHIFQRGRYTTNQIHIYIYYPNILWIFPGMLVKQCHFYPSLPRSGMYTDRIFHRIGLWEKLQESPIFDGKNHGFL